VSDAVSHTTNLFGDRQKDPRAHFRVEGYNAYSDSLAALSSAGRAAHQMPPDLLPAADALAAADPSIRFYRATLGAGGGFLAVDSINGQVKTFLPLIPRETSLLGYLGKSKVFLMNLLHLSVERS
jgi:hypothetical protein